MRGPVVANASPLIGLGGIDRLDVLKDLWGEVLIPEAVHREVVIEGAGRPGASGVALACGSWMRRVGVGDRQEVAALQAVLDEGEAEVIVLGQERTAALLLLDNREPRLFAKSLGLPVMGTLGVLKLAWLRGLVSNPVREARALRRNGFWLDDRLMELLEADVTAGKT